MHPEHILELKELKKKKTLQVLRLKNNNNLLRKEQKLDSSLTLMQC